MPAKPQNKRKINDYLFYLSILVISGLVAFFSRHYSSQFDWTVDGRNTLRPASQNFLKTLQGPVKIIAYASDNKELREQISTVIERFKRAKPNLTFDFVNPAEEPEAVRELGIDVDGQMLIHYEDRFESLRILSEAAIINAIYRLSKMDQAWIVFLSGHGERSPTGPANHDLGQFGKRLKSKGYQILELETALTGSIPDNTALLVISGPMVSVLPGEVEAIRSFIDAGGNLLWLQDSERLNGLDPIGELLGVQFLRGIVVDAESKAYGINNPAFVTLGNYPSHPITNNLQSISLFPKSGAIEYDTAGPFEHTAILMSSVQSWSESGPVKGHLQFNPEQGEKQGPLTIGMALSRNLKNVEKPKDQRIVVVGDGDFLSNTYLGNGANLELGLNIVHWLTETGESIDLPARVRQDQTLNLTPSETAVMGFIFLIAIPGLLLFAGFFNSRRRKKRV